jgi:dTDP-4-amino-4,6-dideoxygalactose transaminase
VHYAGLSVDMDPLIRIKKEHGIAIVEDCAHSIGTTYKGRHTGTIGDAGCFSFYATKNLTTGEGGMITSNSEDVVESLKQLRLHGLSRDAWKRYGPTGSWKYEVKIPGYKYNMTDIQAALGLVQLSKLEDMNAKRASLANAYSERLSEIEGVIMPIHDKERSWHLYTVQFEGGERIRSRVMENFVKRRIGFSVHFIVLHLEDAYSNLGYKYGDMPNAERAASAIISLPFFPDMTINQMNEVCDVIKKTL